MLIIAFTAALEAVGYACRIVMLHNPSYSTYVVMQALLIISPTFLALVNCSATGKLMRMAHGAGHLHPGWVAKSFFASDLLCLGIQGSGAGLSSSVNSGDMVTAKALLIVGLILQLLFFIFFTCITLYINLKTRYGLTHVKEFGPIFFCLYSTIGFMYILTNFRLIEFSNGWYGYVATQGSFFYCFDFLVIFSCFVIITVVCFGFFVRTAQASLPVTAPPPSQSSVKSPKGKE